MYLRIVQEILCNMKDAELEELRARQYWKKAETLRLQAEVGKLCMKILKSSIAV